MLRAQSKKGIILIVVLGMVLMVAVLAQVILRLILSHNRITHHQTSRIQAYYAAMAGVNYALEKLRLGTDLDWQAPFVRSICRTGCVVPDINDSDLPVSIQGVKITGILAGAPGCSYPPPAPADGVCVSAEATYTYVSP